MMFERLADVARLVSVCRSAGRYVRPLAAAR
jgi:hypothetical protein